MNFIILVLLMSSVVSHSVSSGGLCKSFTKSFSSGLFKCASTNKENIGGEAVQASQLGPAGALGLRYKQSSDVKSALPLWKWPDQHRYHLSRRTLGALLGAGVIGTPLEDSQAAPDIASDIKLVTFDGARGTTHVWRTKSFPAGQSEATTTVSDGTLVLQGNVVREPSGATGFVVSRTTDRGYSRLGISRVFPDVSSCEGVSVVARSSTKYKGYRFFFGSSDGLGPYKANFDAPLKDFGTVQIPFKDFSNDWDDSTGDPIKTCRESPENCPDQATLKNMKTLSFWGEGVDGQVHLEVKGISAYGCTTKDPIALATLDGASSMSFSWQLAATTLGLLAFVVVRIRTIPSLVASPLLA